MSTKKQRFAALLFCGALMVSLALAPATPASAHKQSQGKNQPVKKSSSYGKHASSKSSRHKKGNHHNHKGHNGYGNGHGKICSASSKNCKRPSGKGHHHPGSNPGHPASWNRGKGWKNNPKATPVKNSNKGKGNNNGNVNNGKNNKSNNGKNRWA